MRKIIILLIVLIVNAQWVYGKADYFPYNEPSVSYAVKEADVTLNLPLGSTEDTVFCNGRLALPLSQGVKLMGADIKDVARGYNISLDGINCFVNGGVSSNRPLIFVYNNKEYISLYNITEPFGYELIVNVENNSGTVLKEECKYSDNTLTVPKKGKKAYLRLEDIMADGIKPGAKGNYTPDMLEKLKYTAKYLYDRNQEYYIAWIPVYAYPAAGYWNDVSKDYNLYNSYFLYVLDYMTEHNGHLGLHGYTHQYGDNESAVGYEWGEDTPYNFNEQSRRMAAAKEACHKLGYNEEFFEFPHYGATNEQMIMAEYYFDAIYQSYPSDEFTNHITYTTRSGKKVYYIPTPADYVHFRRDESVFDRIKTSYENNYTMSLFYHPVIDKPHFRVETVGNKRVWSYSGEGSLPKIVDCMFNLGYSFGNFR